MSTPKRSISREVIVQVTLPKSNTPSSQAPTNVRKSVGSRTPPVDPRPSAKRNQSSGILNKQASAQNITAQDQDSISGEVVVRVTLPKSNPPPPPPAGRKSVGLRTPPVERRSSGKRNQSSGSLKRQVSALTVTGQDEELDKAALLKQIEVLKGDLERRYSRAFSDSNDETYHRRDSRRSSISSVESGGTRDSQKTEDFLQLGGKTTKGAGLKRARDKNRGETFLTKLTGFFANLDSLAIRSSTARHDACIFFSLYLIPILVIVFIWDLLAVLVFEIPHLSMIDHPGLMLLFHFLGVPTSMYGYMMRVLMGLDKTSLTHLGAISVAVHPPFLFLRAFIEIYFEGFQSQQLIRYENY